MGEEYREGSDILSLSFATLILALFFQMLMKGGFQGGYLADCLLRCASSAIPLGGPPDILSLSFATLIRALFFQMLMKASFQRTEKTKPFPPVGGKGLRCLGGRWDSNPRPSEPQSDVLTN